MTEAPAADASLFAASDVEELARDWITVWQSELASYAGDREAAEAWLRLLGLWAGAMTGLLASMPSPPAADARGRPAGHAGPAETARPAAADSAPGPGMAALERLDQRLARLEERLAALERAIDGGSRAARGKPRPAGRARQGGIRSRGPG